MLKSWVAAAGVAMAALSLWLAGPTRAGENGAVTFSAAELARYDASKRRVSLGNGVRLAYLDDGPRAAPVVVLIHGYTDSARDWEPVVPLLRHRFRVIVVDLRGHGASDKPECCYARFDFADDIERLLKHLHVARADIVGHSLGSVVAQTFAELWPQSTRKLVLVSSTGTTFGGDSGSGVDEWLQSLASLRDPLDPESPFMHGWWHESERINPPAFTQKQRQAAASIPIRIWRAIGEQCLQHVDLVHLLPRIVVPTLLIWGGRDTLVGEQGRSALRTGIADTTVRDFPALGHDLFWEDPAAVTAAMLEFLTSP